MSMGNSHSPESELTGYLLRLFGQMVGFVLALSAFALWLVPEAGAGLSLWRLGLSLALLLTGMTVVLGCAARR
ncbi:hypothetical protein [Salipiger mangrovisoli]|uniref:Uncharacterized protein n=1 Tax=Salipiger mangrovisoli TaxID=2865933 RepID=A0ABR9WWC0_9RHOB|nr:hypothetical protein [Salipiger mangrovisoli]MBE9635583.1 hypothetical protein [Salipiger mangrovisoli]